MRHSRALLLAVIFCAATLTASANPISDIRIIFDPDPPTGIPLTDITSVGSPVTVDWQSCSDAGVPPALSGETACVGLANLTGQEITSLNVQFTVPDDPANPLVGQTVDCENADLYLTSNNCPTGTLTENENVNFTLYGGTPVPNDTDIFFGADAAGLTSPSQFPPLTVTDPAPEPSALLLVSTSLVFLGLGYLRLRRRNEAL